MTTRKPVVLETVRISPPKIITMEFHIRGIAPLVVHAFSAKARQQIMDTQAAGSQARSKRVRAAKDFDQVYRDAFHMGMKTKQPGFPASAFRTAMIDACRLVGYKMTVAKLSVFVEHDDIDEGGYPIVLIQGKPERHESYARNETGVVDIRVRPMWKAWEMKLRVRFDGDQFSASDVTNLLSRAGQQVGIGEGRPNSKKSFGLGWGLFEIVE